MTRSGQPSRSVSSLRLLVTRDFGLLWLGECISQIGDSLNRVALLWFAYQTSHSTLRMSIVGVLQTLPALLLGPVIGVYLDRLRKKPVLDRGQPGARRHGRGHPPPARAQTSCP